MAEPGVDCVDVWRIDLDISDPLCADMRSVLTDHERQRADRFRIEQPRRQYTVARGMLRHILSRYLSTPPKDIGLSYGPQGKPELTDATDQSDICFNVSHSQDLALVAVARQGQVGVDVEHIDRKIRHEDLARRFFSAYEVAEMERMAPVERRIAFFACWTRKEAFLKAKGTGLQLPLSQFDVSVSPDEPAQLLRVGWDPAEVDRWELYNLEVRQGYMAALAVNAPAAIRYRSTFGRTGA